MTLLQCKTEGLKMLFDLTTWAMPCFVNKAASAVPHALAQDDIVPEVEICKVT